MAQRRLVFARETRGQPGQAIGARDDGTPHESDPLEKIAALSGAISAGLHLCSRFNAPFPAPMKRRFAARINRVIKRHIDRQSFERDSRPHQEVA